MVGGRPYVTRCHVCRRRKLKCDGQRPSCQRCISIGLLCTGYERPLEFSFFHGQSKSNEERDPKDDIPLFPKPCPMLPEDQRRIAVSRPQDAKTINKIHTVVDHTLAASQYKVGFLAVLQDRYVPDLPNLVRRGSICSSWVSTACDLSYLNGSDMLGDSLMAMSLILVGGERQDQEISIAGLCHYSRALNGIRAELGFNSGTFDPDHADICLVTCIACAMYEMMANQSFASVMQHLSGVGALLQQRGVNSLRSAVSQRIFHEYRCIDIALCLITRRSSFLSLPEWIDPPWKSTDPHSSNYMHTLLDHAFQIPALLEKFDSACCLPSEPFNHQIFNSLWEDALKIQTSMRNWEVYLRGGDETSQLYIPRLASRTLAEEASDLGEIFPISYEFPSFDLAAALMYYEMFQISLYGLLVDMQLRSRDARGVDANGSTIDVPLIDIRDLTAKSIECADRICQSIEYFFDKSTRITGRMVILSPFEAARRLFARLIQARTGDTHQDIALLQKVRFCNAVNQRFQATGLPVWGV